MYKMNAQILKMLKDNNWLPLTQNILEDLFANPEYPVILEQYFRKFQYLAKITNNLGKLDIERLIQLEGLLAEFYSTLAKNSVGSTAKGELKDLDQKSSILQEVSNGLKANHDFNAENYRQMFFLDEVINYIKFGFSLGIKKSLPFELKSDIELEKSIKIFKDWLNCHNELCDLMKEMENTLFKQFSDEWKKNVFNEDKIQDKIIKCNTMEEAFNIIKSYPLIGNFMAYQLVTDINYSEVVNWKEDEFTVAGPGSLRGIKKCFIDKGKMSNEDIIRYMYEHQDEEFKRLNLDFKKIGNRPLQLIDCQNIFCELDKYCRKALPDLKSNRTKIKKHYVPKKERIEYIYPKKWKI